MLSVDIMVINGIYITIVKATVFELCDRLVIGQWGQARIITIKLI